MSLRPVKPGQVKNALLNALARHNVDARTAESIWTDLTTGNDPRPAHLPERIDFRGLDIPWPAGRAARYIRDNERELLNKALAANNNSVLAPDTTADVARRAYEALYNKTQRDDYDPTPIPVERVRRNLRALGEEAANRDASNDYTEFEQAPVTDPLAAITAYQQQAASDQVEMLETLAQQAHATVLDQDPELDTNPQDVDLDALLRELDTITARLNNQ